MSKELEDRERIKNLETSISNIDDHINRLNKESIDINIIVKKTLDSWLKENGERIVKEYVREFKPSAYMEMKFKDNLRKISDLEKKLPLLEEYQKVDNEAIRKLEEQFTGLLAWATDDNGKLLRVHSIKKVVWDHLEAHNILGAKTIVDSEEAERLLKLFHKTIQKGLEKLDGKEEKDPCIDCTDLNCCECDYMKKAIASIPKKDSELETWKTKVFKLDERISELEKVIGQKSWYKKDIGFKKRFVEEIAELRNKLDVWRNEANNTLNELKDKFDNHDCFKSWNKSKFDKKDSEGDQLNERGKKFLKGLQEIDEKPSDGWGEINPHDVSPFDSEKKEVFSENLRTCARCHLIFENIEYRKEHEKSCEKFMDSEGEILLVEEEEPEEGEDPFEKHPEQDWLNDQWANGERPPEPKCEYLWEQIEGIKRCTHNKNTQPNFRLNGETPGFCTEDKCPLKPEKPIEPKLKNNGIAYTKRISSCDKCKGKMKFLRTFKDQDEDIIHEYCCIKCGNRDLTQFPDIYGPKCPICNDTGINIHVEYDQFGRRDDINYPCQCQTREGDLYELYLKDGGQYYFRKTTHPFTEHNNMVNLGIGETKAKRADLIWLIKTLEGWIHEYKDGTKYLEIHLSPVEKLKEEYKIE